MSHSFGVGAASSGGGDGDGGPLDPARQPLLSPSDVSRTSTSPSLVCRCLLALTNRHLMEFCMVCFGIHLYRHGEIRQFLHLVGVSVQADLFWPLAGIFSCASMVAMYAYGIRGKTLTLWRCTFIALTLCSQLALIWFALNQIGHHYELPARCLLPKGACQISTLVWLPTGLFQSVADSVWRPWYLALYVIPLGVVGKGPLYETPWGQWRQAIMGTVFWFFAVFLFLAARSSAFQMAHPLDRRFLLMVGIAVGVVVLFWMFWLTAPPAARYWYFLAHTWWQLLVDIFRHKQFPRLAVEEYIVILLTVWAFLRFAYLGALTRLARFAARKRMEEMLADALAHPFRAELEQNFAEGVAARMASFSVASTDDPEAGTQGSSGSFRGSLADKHKALLVARKELLLMKAGHKAMLPRFLKITVRRKFVIEDTVSALKDRPVEELLAGKICVKYDSEFGVDAGGLTRDWFDAVGRTLSAQAQAEPQKAFFVAAPDQTLIPRSVGRDYGEVSEKEQDQFRALLALGRFLALAVFHEQPLPASFSLILCKYLLRVPVGLDDVRRLDPAFYNGRVASILKDDGLEQVNAALGEPLTFESAPNEACPKPEELKPGGSHIFVTDANKKEYVQLLCEAYLCGGIRREIQCLLQGFWDVLPYEVLHQCDVRPSELALFLSGSSDLDAEEWKKASEGSSSEDQVVWFWKVVEEMTQEQRCLLLQFTTGSSRLPPGGWPALKPRFTVKVTDAGSGSHLPHAHTCANQIVLYRYITQEQLRSKLLHAILTEDFGFS